MSTRRLFLQGAAVGGVALGAASLFGARPAHADMPTERIQRNLDGTGYSPGPADGTLNTATKAATKRFQADHRLVQDGKPGPVTQSVLAAMVSLVQHKAGATHDSSYGTGTAAKVKAYQSANGLTADGKAGPNTMAKMGIRRIVGLGVSAIGGNIRRTEVIQRAAYWPNNYIEYDNYTSHRDLNNSNKYRKDCSGQVSNAWHTQRSYSTRTISEVSKAISKGSLLPGDILNDYDYHTVVFCGWANSSRTAYYSLEQSGSEGAIGREVTSYPFFGIGDQWTPRRYTKIVWG